MSYQGQKKQKNPKNGNLASPLRQDNGTTSRMWHDMWQLRNFNKPLGTAHWTRPQKVVVMVAVPSVRSLHVPALGTPHTRAVLTWIAADLLAGQKQRKGALKTAATRIIRRPRHAVCFRLAGNFPRPGNGHLAQAQLCASTSRRSTYKRDGAPSKEEYPHKLLP